MRTAKLIPILVVAGLALAGCSAGAAPDSSGSAAPGEPAVPAANMEMKIGYTAVGAAYSDLYVCEDKGVFKKNGLDVTLTTLNSSSQLTAALASNSVQVGAGVAKTTAAGIMGGVDLRYVALPIPVFYMEMWGKDSIKSPEDVKGMKIGLSSPGSLGDASVDAWLKDMGWTDKDVEKVFLKSSSAEVAALRQGAVDVIVTQPPRSASTGQYGFVKVMDFTKYPAAANAYTVMNDYLKGNQEAVAAFVKSEVECLSILHQDKETTIASIKKHTENDNQKEAEYSYNFFEPLWAKAPIVKLDLIDQAFTAAALDGGTKPDDTSKFAVNSFVEQLEEEGFVDSLYK